MRSLVCHGFSITGIEIAPPACSLSLPSPSATTAATSFPLTVSSMTMQPNADKAARTLTPAHRMQENVGCRATRTKGLEEERKEGGKEGGMEGGSEGERMDEQTDWREAYTDSDGN